MIEKFPKEKSRQDHIKTVSGILEEAETRKSRNLTFALSGFLGLVLLGFAAFYISQHIQQRNAPLNQEQEIIIEALIYRISVQQQVKMDIVKTQMADHLGSDEILQKDYDRAKSWLINYNKALIGNGS